MARERLAGLLSVFLIRPSLSSSPLRQGSSQFGGKHFVRVARQVYRLPANADLARGSRERSAVWKHFQQFGAPAWIGHAEGSSGCGSIL
jgi:hypothetical protein